MPKKEEKNIKDKTSFSKKFKAELKKVVWPTPKQLFNNTVAVLVIVIVTTLIVFLLDLAFESMNKYGVNKLKEDIANSSSNSAISNEASDNENKNAVGENSTDENEILTNTEKSTENSTTEN